MGVGVSIYFKSLKNMIIILLLCTLFSAPAYVLFWSGFTLNNPNTTADETFSFPNFIASLSLANIGELAVNVNQLELYEDQDGDQNIRSSMNIEMFCDTGFIGQI